MADPFTLRIFVPDGDPDGLRIIDQFNWTGCGIVFPRERWGAIKSRPEFSRMGVYILEGYEADDNLPTIYIGQGDVVRTRLDSHDQTKEFWTKAVVFLSTSLDRGLNRAHATWLEHALIQRAAAAQQCHLANGTQPQEPALSEPERADMRLFLRSALQMLPVVGVSAFEELKTVAVPTASTSSNVGSAPNREPNTIIVPAQRDGFQRVFLGQNAWWAIRISGGMLPKIKYIAAYQTQPISAVTHIAPVARIEAYGDSGKYKVVFSEPAKEIEPIRFGDAPSGAMQGPRYTTYEKLQKAKTISDLLGRG
jgi:hypothetical protein